MSSYTQTMPGVIQRPSSNVTAAPQPTPGNPQMPGDPNQQQQLLMMLLGLLAASQQGQQQPITGAPAMPAPGPVPGAPPAATPPGLSMLGLRQ